MSITDRLAEGLDTATAEDMERQRKIAEENSVLTNMFQVTAAAPKHGPVRQWIEDNRHVLIDWRAFAQAIDTVFAGITARCLTIEDRITRLHERHVELEGDVGALQKMHEGDSHEAHSEELGDLIGNLSSNHDRLWLKHSDRLDHLQGVISGVAEKIDRIDQKASDAITKQADHLAEIDDRFAETDETIKQTRDEYARVFRLAESIKSDLDQIYRQFDKRIDDLADRLSLVHVQAQGDAKIRVKHWAEIEGGTSSEGGTPLPEAWAKDTEGFLRMCRESKSHITEPERSTFIPERKNVPPDSAGQPEKGPARARLDKLINADTDDNAAAIAKAYQDMILHGQGFLKIEAVRPTIDMKVPDFTSMREEVKVARTREDKAARLDELEKAHQWVFCQYSPDRPRNWPEYLAKRRDEIEKGAA